MSTAARGCAGGPLVSASLSLCASDLQDSDLKHYLDNCGNLMSMHNVKVRLQGGRRSAVGRSPPGHAARLGLSFTPFGS